MRVQRKASGKFMLTQQQVDELSAVLGATPVVSGLSRVDVQILAALARSPRGVASVREAARRAGVSPTAATRALARLTSRGLITATRTMTAQGHATEATVYRVRFGSGSGLSLPQ